MTLLVVQNVCLSLAYGVLVVTERRFKKLDQFVVPTYIKLLKRLFWIFILVSYFSLLNQIMRGHHNYMGSVLWQWFFANLVDVCWDLPTIGLILYTHYNSYKLAVPKKEVLLLKSVSTNETYMHHRSYLTEPSS